MKKVIFFFVLLAGACQQTEPKIADNGEISAAERQAIVRDAEKTLQDYFSDMRKSGLKAEFTYLDSSADFFWVPPGHRSPISYDSVATILNLRAPAYTLIENSWDTLSIIPLTHTLASYTGRLQSTMTDTSGKSATYTLMETGLLIRRGESWKLLHGQTSVVK